jgi:hypothetical protein
VINFTSFGVSEYFIVRTHAYFTPYGTLEIWSDEDYKSLDRNWLINTQNSPSRIVVSRDSIPDSNIPFDFEPSEPWHELYQCIRVEGLAYTIPMLATHPDTLALDTTDNVITDTTNRYDNCSNQNRRRYVGSIFGNVFDFFRITYPGRQSDFESFPLEGLRVEVWDYDNGWNNDYLGNDVTDENGNFSVDVNTCQANENGELEIFVRVVAKNDEFEIVGKNTRYFGQVKHVDTDIFAWGYNNGTPSPMNFFTIVVNNGAHRAVSLAQKGYRFVNSNSGTILENGLVIRGDLNVDDSHFYSNSYCGLPVPTNVLQGLATVLSLPIALVHHWSVGTKPTLVVASDSWENDIFHELGHDVMWQLKR